MKGTIRRYLFKTTILLLMCFIAYKGQLTCNYVQELREEYKTKTNNGSMIVVRMPRSDIQEFLKHD